MSEIKNPLAFPQNDTAEYTNEGGMTLRDYFAAKAMQGLCASNESGGLNGMVWKKGAKEAYQIADAMLKQRTK